jgi:hypothetical protein
MDEGLINSYHKELIDKREKSLNERELEKEKPNVISSEEPNNIKKSFYTWQDLLHSAKNLSPTTFSSNSLGNEILDFALNKACKNLSELDIPHIVIKKRLIEELKAKRIKTPISVIRFLRNIDTDLFLECPECSTINDLEWDVCKECGFKN